MRKFLDCLFEGAGYLAGLFMIATLLAVLSSILGRLLPVFELHGADAYAGYFYLGTEFAQGVCVQFGICEAAVAGKAAAAYFFGYDDFG